MFKKHIIAFLILLFSSIVANAQAYKAIDSLVSIYPTSFKSPTKLANRIAKDFDSDLEKVRAVYFWIANNVVYSMDESQKFNYTITGGDDYLRKEKKYIQKLSTRVVSKGKAVCEGYSVLFTEVCKELNIKSKVVSGSAKTKIKDIGKRFYSNHAWNIVLIEGESYLLDVTWGAGSYNNRFIKDINPFYFLTDPKLFISKHYPNAFEFALLDNKISREEFLNAPLVYNHDFELLSPLNGIIDKQQKRIKFSFKCNPGTYAVDYQINNKDFSLSNFKCLKNKIDFEVDLNHVQNPKELTIFLDYQAIVGFKLK